MHIARRTANAAFAESCNRLRSVKTFALFKRPVKIFVVYSANKAQEIALVVI